MVYVLALMSSSGNEMTLAARGRYMAKAIDIYEVFRNKTQFAKECKATFTTNTVKMEDRNVSELLLKITWK
jgi:Alba.